MLALYLLLIVVFQSAIGIPSHYGFNRVTEVYLPDEYLHLNIDLGFSRLRSVREKTLQLKRTATELIGLCAFDPLDDTFVPGLESSQVKYDKYLTFVKEIDFNVDELDLNPLRDSFRILDRQIQFSSEEAKNKATSVMNTIKSKRSIQTGLSYSNYHNGKLISTTTELGREGTVIAVSDDFRLNHGRQANEFIAKFTSFDTLVKELKIADNKEELCNVILPELKALSEWGSAIFRNFIYNFDKIVNGIIPKSMFNDEYLNALRTKINEKVDSGSIQAPDVDKLDYSIEVNGDFVQIIIFIPVYKETFELYEHSGKLPLLEYNDNAFALQLSPVNDDRFIAISDSDNYLIFNKESLERCTEMHGNYFCPQTVKYLTQETLKDECIYNLYTEDSDGIFNTCNILGKLADEHVEELSPNCYQIYSNPGLKTVLKSDEDNDSQVNHEMQVIELTDSSRQVVTPLFHLNFDTADSKKSCEADEQKVSKYWGEEENLPRFIKDRISSLEPFQKELFFDFSENPTKYDYFKTHIYNLESHIHIFLTLIVLSGIKFILFKIFKLISKAVERNTKDTLDDDFRNELKPLRENNTSAIIKPSSPKYSLYPDPPMM